MVRAAKSTENVPAPVASAEKPKTEKKVKTVKAEVAALSPAPEAVSAETESIDSSVSLTSKLAEFSEKINKLSAVVTAMKTEYKVLDKAIARELKTAQKASQKKKRASGNRAPSGFVKPTLISDELAAFLGKEKGTHLARTAVSKEINAYIRAANLQDPTNGRKINPDAKLAKLLKLAKGDELTYFNLQTYMKHHFVKTAPAPVAV